MASLYSLEKAEDFKDALTQIAYDVNNNEISSFGY